MRWWSRKKRTSSSLLDRGVFKLPVVSRRGCRLQLIRVGEDCHAKAGFCWPSSFRICIPIWPGKINFQLYYSNSTLAYRYSCPLQDRLCLSLCPLLLLFLRFRSGSEVEVLASYGWISIIGALLALRSLIITYLLVRGIESALLSLDLCYTHLTVFIVETSFSVEYN